MLVKQELSCFRVKAVWTMTQIIILQLINIHPASLLNIKQAMKAAIISFRVLALEIKSCLFSVFNNNSSKVGLKRMFYLGKEIQIMYIILSVNRSPISRVMQSEIVAGINYHYSIFLMIIYFNFFTLFQYQFGSKYLLIFSYCLIITQQIINIINYLKQQQAIFNQYVISEHLNLNFKFFNYNHHNISLDIFNFSDYIKHIFKIMEQDRRQEQLKKQQQKEEQEYDTFLYKFQQQIIDAWKPIPYTKNNVILYTILTVICVVLGLVLILTSPTTPEIQQRYDDSTTGEVTFQLNQDLSQPSYFYYGLTNYYQNHRRYLKYFSVDQMKGSIIDEASARSSCGDNLFSNEQVGAPSSFNQSAVAHPCGARAKSYLKIKGELDSFTLKNTNGTLVTLDRTGVAWPDDPAIYINSQNVGQQIINNTDEAWLVWFRPAARNQFFKLYAKITSDLPAGNYTFGFNNSFNMSGGQKYFHLSKSNYVGNKDLFLGIAFLSLGGGCLVVLIIFIAKCVTERRERPKDD